MKSIEFIKEMLYWTNEDNVKRKKILIQILNDLERLEQLEKENKELKEQRLSLSLQLQDYRLIKEITLPNVLEENEKLNKAIEFIKNKLKIGLIEDKQKFDFIYYWLSLNGIAEEELTPQEYELLKEAIEE